MYMYTSFWIKKLKEYKRELEIISKKIDIDMELRQISYSIAAYDELIYRLYKNKNDSPIEIVEEYIQEMDIYSMCGERLSFIFSCGYDVGTDVLDQMLSMYMKGAIQNE